MVWEGQHGGDLCGHDSLVSNPEFAAYGGKYSDRNQRDLYAAVAIHVYQTLSQLGEEMIFAGRGDGPPDRMNGTEGHST